MDIAWDGVTRVETLKADSASNRQALADAAKRSDWPGMLEIIEKEPSLANVTRPGGTSLYAPLHQVAHGGGPVEVALRLIALGGWRTLHNLRGERPVDVADRQGHLHLISDLTPVIRHPVPLGVLHRIERLFHEVIRRRAEQLIDEHQLRLPDLEPLLELEQPKMWFAVPGMYGGFSYEITSFGVEARLDVSSWSRVVGGSGQRHSITTVGSELVEEGFV